MPTFVLLSSRVIGKEQFGHFSLFLNIQINNICIPVHEIKFNTQTISRVKKDSNTRVVHCYLDHEN